MTASILLDSGSDHGKPHQCFFFGSSLERFLYVIPVEAGVLSGRSRIARKRKKNCVSPTFRRAGPNFERPLLGVVSLFCGAKNTASEMTCEVPITAVLGRTGGMCGLWACHKIQLENHQLGITTIDQIDTCASETMAAAAPLHFADNGRREKPTTPSWYSCIIGPGSNFQIVNPSPCRPTRRAEIPSRERVTMTLCQI